MTPSGTDRAAGAVVADRKRVRTGALLVDLDNFDELRDVRDADAFASALMRMIRLILIEASEPLEHLSISLYGGWREGLAFTARASEVAQLVAQADLFPIIYDRHRVSGTMRVADALIYAPGSPLPHTYRPKSTAPRFRKNNDLADETCPGDQSCSAKRLSKWSETGRKICPTDGCQVIFREAFRYREQKMVDTMMAIDIIELAIERRTDLIALATDDTDLVPALLYAAAKSSALLIALRKHQISADLAALLNAAGVKQIEGS